MSAIAIMPARGGSKRIKNKNMVDFCGRPLMTFALAAARSSGLFDLIHVSTEDAAIAAVAEAAGFPPEFARDSRLADDTTPLLPVLKWVIEQFTSRGRAFDTVCLLMPTAPLIEASDLSGGMTLYRQHGGQRSVLAVSTFPCPAEWAMHLGPDGTLTPREPGKDQIRSQDLEPSYYDSGTFILFPTSTIVGYPAVSPAYVGYKLPRWKAVDIDEPEDLELARRLYRSRPSNSAM